jgi:hypothetical protein
LGGKAQLILLGRINKPQSATAGSRLDAAFVDRKFPQAKNHRQQQPPGLWERGKRSVLSIFSMARFLRLR